jgi:outer membrane protein
MGAPKTAIALLLSLILMGTTLSVSAQDNSSRRLASPRSGGARISLGEAVQITLQRNPRIGEALSKIRQLEWQSQAVYSRFFPSAGIVYTGTWPKYLVGGGEFGPPDHVSRYSQFTGRTRLNLPDMQYPYRIDPYKRFSGNLTVTQPLYQGGKVTADYNFSKLSVNNSELQLQVDRQNLILAVYQAYYSMMLGEKLLGVVNESIETLRKLRELNIKFLRAGVVTKTDVLSTEGQLAQASVERRAAQTDIDTQRVILNTLMANFPETPLAIRHDYQYRENSYAIPAIYNAAMGNRDEIVQATNNIRQAIEATKSATSSLLPSIGLVALGTRTNDDWNVLDPEGNNAWSLSTVLTWTFDFFEKTSTVKQRREGIQEQILARQKLVDDILRDVKAAYLQVKKFEGDIQDYRTALAFRTENFRLFQKRYQEADVSYTEVLIAQRELTLAQADYYRALIGYRITLAVLERAVGLLRN